MTAYTWADFEPPPLPSVVIMDDDGTHLLRITRQDGDLDVTWAEGRLTEAAQRFVTEVRRLLGLEEP